MDQTLIIEYKSDIMKIFGLALMYPFSTKLTSFFMGASFGTSSISFAIVSWFSCIVLFFIGSLHIYWGLEIIEKYQKQEYSNKRIKDYV